MYLVNQFQGSMIIWVTFLEVALFWIKHFIFEYKLES